MGDRPPDTGNGPDSEIDFASFTAVERGNLFEDFQIGQEFQHHWGRTITDGDNTIFSTATCSWNPLYLNAEFAREHGHSTAVVNPMLVLGTVVGLSVEDLSEAGGPFLGIDDCTFVAPVYPGDTVTARSEVVALRPSSSRPDSGIVTWRTRGHNQHGDIVIELLRTNLIARRAVVS